MKMKETLCAHGIGHSRDVHTCDGCCVPTWKVSPSETNQAADAAFLLWHASLDPIAVAANESFHSEKHRNEMARHEFDKQVRQAAPAPRYPTETRWEIPTRAKRKVSPRPRVEVRSDFTVRQIEIATAALEKTNGKN